MQASLCNGRRYLNHGDFHYISSRALDGSIDGLALFPFLHRQVQTALQVGEIAAATNLKHLTFNIKHVTENIKEKPQFGVMKNRQWDLKDWYGDPRKMKKDFGWKSKISLREGLIKLYKQ